MINLIILNNYATDKKANNDDDLTYIEVGQSLTITASKERLIIMKESDLDNLLAGNFNYFKSKNTIDYLNNFYIPNLIKLNKRELLIKDNRNKLIQDERDYYKNQFEVVDIQLAKFKLSSSNWKLAFSISVGVGLAELGIICLLVGIYNK